MVFLVDQVSKGVSNVSRESIGAIKENINGVAENKNVAWVQM